MVAKKNPHQRFKKGQRQLTNRFAKNSGDITPEALTRAALGMARVGWAADAVEKVTGFDVVKEVFPKKKSKQPVYQQREPLSPELAALPEVKALLLGNTGKKYAKGGGVRKPKKR